MSAQFGLYLGEDRIPVINWINRHGPPEGRDLRFTLPTETKAKVEANLSKTFRLERDGKQWEFEILKLTPHSTGTNGLPAVGRVKVTGLGERSEIKFGKKPLTGLGIPKLDGASEPKLEKRDPSGLKKLLLKKKHDTERGVPAASSDSPPTRGGLPGADDPLTGDAPVADDADPPTEKGHPAVVPGQHKEEE